MLRGGRIAKSSDWPASLLARFQVAPGRFASCTAALVGPSAMLTAAHCVPTSGVVGFSYDGRNYTTNCTRHPQYVDGSDPSADYAFCRLATPFVQPSGFTFETVRTAAFAPLAGRDVMLTGYGCMSDDANNQQSDQYYRYGFNRIDETSVSQGRRRGARFYAGSEDNNLFTTDDGANVCPGDSGGPAFLRTAGTDAEAVNNRVIVAVNSRVFYRDAARTTFGSSLLSATGGPDFRTWARDWATNNGVAVCGITTATIPNCRS